MVSAAILLYRWRAMSSLRDRLQDALGEPYVIERELSGGGMSRVFVATEVELGRKVVVTVLPAEMSAEVNADRFRREIQMAASLQHPHIVPLLRAGSRADLLWYTMPLVQGESLRARLARESELPVPEAVRILRDVTAAIAYAHAHGVVHRDIKPDNILLTDRYAVVTDFGVAKAVSEATGETSLTSVGVALGTPAYMAPEQAAADPHTDHRADIYAVGVMGYEMLAGSPPFNAPSPQMILAAQVTQQPAHVTQHRATVPPALAAIVMRCLEKKAADRFQSAAELFHQLGFDGHSEWWYGADRCTPRRSRHRGASTTAARQAMDVGICRRSCAGRRLSRGIRSVGRTWVRRDDDRHHASDARGAPLSESGQCRGPVFRRRHYGGDHITPGITWRPRRDIPHQRDSVQEH